jgi:CDP-diacylglycerol---glycerol-3-phosphate 3-phosphatidyltransferase
MVIALFVALIALAAITVRTRRPPVGQIPDFERYLHQWAAQHDGYDATGTRLLRGWLAMVYRLARPLAAAGVHPDAVTVWGVWLALVVVALAEAGHGWAVAGGVLLVAGGLVDALDGAVAALTGRATAWGYLLDSMADRVTEALFLLAAWRAGSPAWSAVASGIAFGLLEYLRARAGNAGAQRVPVITVGERPQRVICCAIAVGAAGLAPSHAPLLGGLSLGVLLVLSVAGLLQLGIAVRRQLRRHTT